MSDPNNKDVKQQQNPPQVFSLFGKQSQGSISSLFGNSKTPLFGNISQNTSGLSSLFSKTNPKNQNADEKLQSSNPLPSSDNPPKSLFGLPASSPASSPGGLFGGLNKATKQSENRPATTNSSLFPTNKSQSLFPSGGNTGLFPPINQSEPKKVQTPQINLFQKNTLITQDKKQSLFLGGIVPNQNKELPKTQFSSLFGSKNINQLTQPKDNKNMFGGPQSTPFSLFTNTTAAPQNINQGEKKQVTPVLEVSVVTNIKEPNRANTPSITPSFNSSIANKQQKSIISLIPVENTKQLPQQAPKQLQQHTTKQAFLSKQPIITQIIDKPILKRIQTFQGQIAKTINFAEQKNVQISSKNNDNQPRIQEIQKRTFGSNNQLQQSKLDKSEESVPLNMLLEKQSNKSEINKKNRQSGILQTKKQQVFQQLSVQQIYNLHRISIGSNQQNQNRNLYKFTKQFENAFCSVFSLKQIINNTSNNQTKQNLQIHQNQIINKLYNDIIEMIISAESLTSKSYRALSQLLLKLVKQKNIEQFIYPNNTPNQSFIFSNLYLEQTTQSKVLNEYSKQLIPIINALSKQIQGYRNILIQIIDNYPRILFKTKILQTLLIYCVRRQVIPLELDSESYVQTVSKIRNETIDQCFRVLIKWGRQFSLVQVKPNQSSTCFEISPSAISQSLVVIDSIRGKQFIINLQKIILIIISQNSFSIIEQSPQVRQSIISSKSIQMLPFKFLVQQNFFPSPKNLFAFVRGSEWIQWLQYYIKNHSQFDSNPLQMKQLPEIIQVIKSFDESVINRILKKGSIIAKFICQCVKQQNQMVLLFQVLESFIYNPENITSIQMIFFSNTPYAQYYTKSLVRDIQSENQTQQPEVTQAKLHYLLKTLIYAPEKIFEYEKTLFDQWLDQNQEQNKDTCHKSCLFLIDLIKYYSQNYVSQILAKIFQSITSLISNIQTKKFMIAALNVYKPELILGDKSLSPNLIKGINEHLKFILNDKDFYFSLSNIQQQTLPLSSKMYLYRNTHDYNQIFQDTNGNLYLTCVYPSFWVAHLMQIVSRQNYNPQILESILSKLIIFPSQVDKKNIQIPYLIDCIVKIMNNIKFQEFVMEFIEVVVQQKRYSINQFNNKISILNKKLLQSYSQNYKNVFFTLKLIKTILTLQRIHSKYITKYPKHFIITALSKLQCLQKISKLIVNTSVQLISNVNPILCILSLIDIEQKLVNLSSSISNLPLQYTYMNEQDAINFLKNKQKDLQIIDGFVIRNFLTFPKNRYLESMQSMRTIAMDIIGIAVNENPKLSLERCVDVSVSGERGMMIEYSESVLEMYVSKIINLLEQNCLFTKESILKLLLCCQKSFLNRSISNEIINRYLERNKQPLQTIRLNSLLTILINLQYQDMLPSAPIANRDQILDRIIETALKDKFKILSQLSSQYQQARYNILAFHQVERIFLERQIMKTADMYIWLKAILQITLIMIFNRKFNAAKYSSMLMSFIVKNRIVCIKGQEIYNLDELKLQYPRMFIKDALEYHITKLTKIQQHSITQQIQIKNVVQWSLHISATLNKTLNNFLLTLLSIDKTFYSNLPISFSTYKYPELFCHMHLGKTNYTAIQLMGKNQSESIENVKSIGDLIIPKLSFLEVNEQQGIKILSACINWLNARSLQASKASIVLCQSLLNQKEQWLKQQIENIAQCRLLFSIILTLKQIPSQYNQQIRATIYQTIKSQHCQNHIRHQIISLFNIIPPLPHQHHIIETIVNMWCMQSRNEFFYNQSIVIIKFANLYPLTIAKCNKPLLRCQKIKNIISNNRARYQLGQRGSQNISWIWTLRIVANMALNYNNSILVSQEVINFFENHRRKIIETLEQIITISKQSYANNSIPIQYAFLQQLDETFEMLACIFSIEAFSSVKRELFEQILYVLSHKSIGLFTGTSLVKKKYVAISDNEKQIKKIYYSKSNLDFGNNSLSLQASSPFSQTISIQYQNIFNLSANISQTFKLSMFNLAMELKYFKTLKSFLIAFSLALKQSQYIEKHFNEQPIANNYRYGISYWDRINKSIVDIGRSIIVFFNKLKSMLINLDDVLTLLNDCYKAPNTCVSNGYLNTTSKIPNTKGQLFGEIRQMGVLLGQLGYTHLNHQCKYKKKNFTLMKNHLQGFQKKILQLVRQFEEQFKNTQDDSQLENSCFNDIKVMIQSLYIR